MSKRVTFLILIIVVLYLGLSFLYHRPQVSVTYEMNKWNGKKLEAVRILQYNKSKVEIGDPLPVWLNLKIESVTILDKPKEMVDNFHELIHHDNRILARQLNDGNLEGTKKICPTGSCVVNVEIKKTWWNFYSGFDRLDGANVSFCVNPDYSNKQPQDEEEHHMHIPECRTIQPE